MECRCSSYPLTLGAITDVAGTRFRVWAPEPETISLRLTVADGSRDFELRRDEGGYGTVHVDGVGAGARYVYVVDGRELPDPCSRSQPGGVHGQSEVVDPAAFTWTDGEFVAADRRDLVIYECHVGTLTGQGTFDGAIEQLSRLENLGVNAIELMPVAAFAGVRNWGYDGAALFAPFAGYGGPGGLRRFVDAAHRHGMAVVLDVVYNHLGLVGNYTEAFSKQYLTARHQTPWGDAVNFDGDGAEGVRRFVKENVLHWWREYHIDGFRFDAAHAIFDDSSVHILAEVSELFADTESRPYLIAETNENENRYLREVNEGGRGFDAVWSDDFHHIARNMLHMERHGYLASYRGDAEELAHAVTRGWLYEGQPDAVTGEPRGTSSDGIVASSLVFAIQNHDQIANRPFGLRASSTMGFSDYMAVSGLLLLAPETPLIFQGQEFFATTPFYYFTNHGGELGRTISEGRRREFEFPESEVADLIADPEDETTFLASRLRTDERLAGAGRLVEAFYEACISLRAEDIVLREVRRQTRGAAAQTSGQALLFTFAGASGTRYLAVNFGDDVRFVTRLPLTETVLSSDETRFGGAGRLLENDGESVTVPAHSCAFLRPL